MVSNEEWCNRARRNHEDLRRAIPRLAAEERSLSRRLERDVDRRQEARQQLRILETAEVAANGLPAGRAAMAIIRALAVASLAAGIFKLRDEIARLERNMARARARIANLARRLRDNREELARIERQAPGRDCRLR